MIYAITGVCLLVFAWRTPHRGAAAFWALLGLIFLLGDRIPYWVSGLMVIAMVILDGAGHVSPEPAPPQEEKHAEGWRTLVPVLLIPVVTLGLATAYRIGGGDANLGAFIGLVAGGVAATIGGVVLCKASVVEAMDAGRRLN